MLRHRGFQSGCHESPGIKVTAGVSLINERKFLKTKYSFIWSCSWYGLGEFYIDSAVKCIFSSVCNNQYLVVEVGFSRSH